MELSFQGINRLFILSFENDAQSISNKRYYLPNVKIKDYNVVIDRNFFFFDQPVKNDKITYENIRKTATRQEDDFTTGCLFDYIHFKKFCNIITIDLSKQRALDADLRAIQQINFTANLDQAGEKRMFFIPEEAKETVLDFSEGTVRVL